MKHMLGIAIIGGDGPSPQALREIASGADILVAADSGLIAAERAGLTAHWVVGDMDSLEGSLVSPENLPSGNVSPLGSNLLEKYPPERIIRYPPDKDYTDTELALMLLREKGCSQLWLAGGGGGRVDHLFAIRSLFERQDSPDRWFTNNEDIHCLREGTTLNVRLPPGQKHTGSLPSALGVSVFPLGSGPWQAESFGLKWPLNGLNWETGGGGLGLSNIAENGAFEIRSIRGRFMVICLIA